MTGPAPDAGAFDLVEPGGEAGRDAALCLHGLTGTPYEIRPLAEALAATGLRARGPLLPGHGSDPEELARQPYRAWLDAARAEWSALREEHERVYLVGLSLGGLLSLALAAELGAPGLVVVGTPLRLRPPIPQLLPFVKPWLRQVPKGQGPDIRDPEARARHPGYPVIPLASVHQLVRLQRRVLQALPLLRAPALVAHGRHDRTARPRDAAHLARAIPGAELLWLERSGHVATVDYDGALLAERTRGFVSRLRAEARRPAEGA